MPATAHPDAALLLFIGSDQENRVVRDGRKVHVSGTSDIYRLLDGHEPDVPFHRFHVTPNVFRQNRVPELGQYRCLLNLITEPEGNQRVLDILRRLLRGAAGRVVNRPEAVLLSGRDQVARRLEGISGLRVPRVVRIRSGKAANPRSTIQKAKLDGPLIIRAAGTHTGIIVGLFDGPDQLPAELGPGSDYLATEFVDARSADGLYRKYRVFFIGRHIILRHLIASDYWNIHAKDRTRFMIHRPDLMAEEKPLFERPEGAFAEPVIKTLRAVRDRMKLDMFGMDFAILPDQRVLLFEANASMNFFPFRPEPEFAHVTRCLKPAQLAFREMLGLPVSDAAATSLQSA